MTPSEFAIHVVRQLRQAGHQALWAGGCVRDQLMGFEPQDYDVATSATPEQVRQLFGKRRTLAIGEAFGVIVVLGPKSAGQIEVATFRQDLGYSDGRRPDAVAFSSPAEDAQRRDFTINGMFYDPLTAQPLDYVGGREDLDRGIIRAIGQPEARFAEDKLRMLRAVRFAATFDFIIEPATLAAIRRQPDALRVVSGERIAVELRRTLCPPHRERGFRLLHTTGLLPVLLPDSQTVFANHEVFERTASRLAHLPSETEFALPLAAILRAASDAEQPWEWLRATSAWWKLTKREVSLTRWLLQNLPIISAADRLPWPRVQPLLVHADATPLLDFASAVCQAEHESPSGLEFCRAQLALPAAQLNPPRLLDGHDLQQLGLASGPAFARILQAVRDAQLTGDITDKPAALRWAAAQLRRGTDTDDRAGPA